ncbi:hypothetical protein MNBD_GAMMA10-1068 [hydrothermal vent metagenome]|uniref:Uncharacterized protein n=1 Tax=hydrothermal vent metagenome TaxID=652676 RepID=A0A3B0Y4W3_9ZZZZ
MKYTITILLLTLFLAPGTGHANLKNTLVKHTQLPVDSIAGIKSTAKIFNVARDCLLTSDNVQSDNTQPCAYVYTNSKKTSIIIELCQPVSGMKPGLYLLTDKVKPAYYNWFDKDVMQWACSEKSAMGNTSEYWGLRTAPGGEFSALIFNYYINASTGYYYLKLDKKGSIKTLDENSLDLT